MTANSQGEIEQPALSAQERAVLHASLPSQHEVALSSELIWAFAAGELDPHSYAYTQVLDALTHDPQLRRSLVDAKQWLAADAEILSPQARALLHSSLPVQRRVEIDSESIWDFAAGEIAPDSARYQQVLAALALDPEVRQTLLDAKAWIGATDATENAERALPEISASVSAQSSEVRHSSEVLHPRLAVVAKQMPANQGSSKNSSRRSVVRRWWVPLGMAASVLTVALLLRTPTQPQNEAPNPIRSLPSLAMTLDSLPVAGKLRDFAKAAPDLEPSSLWLYKVGRAGPHPYAYSYAEGALLLLSDKIVAKHLLRAQALSPKLIELLQMQFPNQPERSACATDACAQARMLGAAALATALYCQRPLDNQSAEYALLFFQRGARTPSILPSAWPVLDTRSVCAAAAAVVAELAPQ